MKSYTESHTVRCQSCENVVAPGQGYCACGRPTPYTSFSERAAYEVTQWRAYQERAAATVTA